MMNMSLLPRTTAYTLFLRLGLLEDEFGMLGVFDQ